MRVGNLVQSIGYDEVIAVYIIVDKSIDLMGKVW